MLDLDGYKAQVRADAMGSYVGYCDGFGEVYDELFVDDAVTGNGSGSYTFDAAVALDNVRGLLGDEAFAAELADLGMGAEVFARDPESVDVIARCLALGCVSGDLERAWDALAG